MFVIDKDKCLGCELCVKTCKANGQDIIKDSKSGGLCIDFTANDINTNSVVIHRTAKNSCDDCQDCFLICPAKAIVLIFDYVNAQTEQTANKERTTRAEEFSKLVDDIPDISIEDVQGYKDKWISQSYNK